MVHIHDISNFFWKIKKDLCNMYLILCCGSLQLGHLKIYSSSLMKVINGTYFTSKLAKIWQGGREGDQEGGRALCVQMDFTRTFQTTTMCNNINHVWRHFYKILVVLKYHRRPWANIFDTDSFRSINIPKNTNTPL